MPTATMSDTEKNILPTGGEAAQTGDREQRVPDSAVPASDLPASDLPSPDVPASDATAPAVPPSGVLVLNKPAGFTSHDCVNRIRRLYNTRQVGHTGTLDPMAEGVLPVMIGRAVKASEYLTDSDKIYRATLRLGLESDTEDSTGTILRESDAIPSPARVKEVCASFVGEIAQIPPMYSALKVGGRKLVDIARKGGTVERQARQVTVLTLTCDPLTETGDPPRDYVLRVTCSKGTYIRTLCADIGRALGCGGLMTALTREKAAGFTLENARTLAQLEAMSPAQRAACLKPTESLFDTLPRITLPPFFAKLCRSGCEIYQSKIGTCYPTGQRVTLGDGNGFFALGEVGEYPDGSAVKALKLFVL